MQIQTVNNSPNFQANHLRTAKMVNKKIKVNSIDIYSINKSDKSIIDNLLLKLDAKKRSDANGVREKNNVNDTVSYVLRKASMLDGKAKDGVYIAVKNGRKVTAFTNDEEAEAKMNNLVPFFVEDALKDAGAFFMQEPEGEINVIEDDNLITAQNYQSSEQFAQAIINYLDRE